jgi:hypothetical protein
MPMIRRFVLATPKKKPGFWGDPGFPIRPTWRGIPTTYSLPKCNGVLIVPSASASVGALFAVAFTFHRG